MSFGFNDHDDFGEDEEFVDFIVPKPGEDRTRKPGIATPIVDALCTHAYRILDSLDKHHSIVEMFEHWGEKDIYSYEQAVAYIHEANGDPLIDEEHVANDGSIPKDI